MGIRLAFVAAVSALVAVASGPTSLTKASALAWNRVPVPWTLTTITQWKRLSREARIEFLRWDHRYVAGIVVVGPGALRDIPNGQERRFAEWMLSHFREHWGGNSEGPGYTENGEPRYAFEIFTTHSGKLLGGTVRAFARGHFERWPALALYDATNFEALQLPVALRCVDVLVLPPPS